MCRFLGIAPAPVGVRYARTNPFPLRELLLNYEDVASSLRPTEHAWMLEEAGGS